VSVAKTWCLELISISHMWKNRTYVDILSLLWWSYNNSNNSTTTANNNDNDITIVYLIDPRGGSSLLNYIIIETNYACIIYNSINKSHQQNLKASIIPRFALWHSMEWHPHSENSGKIKKPLSVPLNCKEQESFKTAFLKSKKPSRLAYQKLVEANCNNKISSQEKWSKVFPEARDLI